VRTPKSLPPELVAASIRAKQDTTALDSTTILSQKANVAEIENIGKEDWITLYSFESDQKGSKCYFCGLVPRNRVSRAMTHDSWDLMIGNGLPGFIENNVSGRKRTKYDRFGASSVEPLVFSRSFHDLKPSQFDLLEEFRHFHNLYHDRRNERYIYIDDRGEEDLVVEVSHKRVRAKIHYTRQFMAARQLYLAVFFDHNARMAINGALDRTKLSNETVVRSDLRFSFNVGDIGGETISRLIGKKIIAPLPVSECGIWPYDTRNARQFAEFIIGTDAKGRSEFHVCDEETLANYFGKNPDAPHYARMVQARSAA
jgi:hypothetical protein